MQHAPEKQSPFEQGVLSGFEAPLHLPEPSQAPLPHADPPTPVQSAHAPPVTPHAASLLPGLHVVPVQQPVHLLSGHVPPAPLSAPGHLPSQAGFFLQTPVGSHS